MRTQVVVPEFHGEPRGAKLVGWLVDAAATLRAYLRARRAEHAARALYRDAEQVRRLARRVQDTDPGLASDLNALANRT